MMYWMIVACDSEKKLTGDFAVVLARNAAEAHVYAPRLDIASGQPYVMVAQNNSPLAEAWRKEIKQQ